MWHFLKENFSAIRAQRLRYVENGGTEDLTLLQAC